MPDIALKSVPPISIAVVGVGRIGSTFAYKLAGAGHDVTLVARRGSQRFEQLKRDGGILLKTGERTQMRVVDELEELKVYDLVIVTTLAHQIDSILPALRRSKARCVHFMFVNFNPEGLRDTIGPDRCTFGMPAVMAMLDDEGKLSPTISKRQKTSHSDQRWVDLFEAAGIPSAFEADMLLWLRCHVPLCCAFESIAVAGKRRGGGATWKEAMTVARGLHGGFAIVQGLGYRLYPSAKSTINSFPNFVLAFMMWAFSRIPSMRELLATGFNECRALIDTMVTAADGKPALPKAVRAVLAMRPGDPAGAR
jgi:2-dehydropantoate 2-reductase